VSQTDHLPEEQIHLAPRRRFQPAIATLPWEMLPDHVKGWITTNQRYVDAGAGKGRIVGLCMGIVDGQPCVRHHLKTSDFCRSCKRRRS